MRNYVFPQSTCQRPLGCRGLEGFEVVIGLHGQPGGGFTPRAGRLSGFLFHGNSLDEDAADRRVREVDVAHGTLGLDRVRPFRLTAAGLTTRAWRVRKQISIGGLIDLVI